MSKYIRLCTYYKIYKVKESSFSIESFEIKFKIDSKFYNIKIHT